MTFGERRKRADIQLIQRDFEELESAFLADAQKLNKKRHSQLLKRVKGVVDELIEAHVKNDSEEVEGILATLKMPSSKEWNKLIKKLVLSSATAGVLRAHLEIDRLRELFEFDEYNVIPEGYDYDVVFPKEGLDFIDKYSYQIGVITEDTVLNRIRAVLKQGLEEGYAPEELYNAVRDTAGSWMSEGHAQTIARTESSKMYNAGRMARYTDDENTGFIEALQYDAIIDRRTTEVCKHLDGMTIAVTNQAVIAKFTPPNHYQCRATWLPVTKYEVWEDNFDDSVKPEKGFEFTAPTTANKLTKGKAKGTPLVRKKPAKKKVDPSTITDPKKIRKLDDEDFKVAIKNVAEHDVKLQLVQERAERMLIADEVLDIELVDPKVEWYGFDEDESEGMFKMFSRTWDFYMTRAEKGIVEALMASLYGKSGNEQHDILKNFIEQHKKDKAFMPLVRELRKALKYSRQVSKLKNGLPTVTQSAETVKALTIKQPPMTANYRNATGLRQAITDGEAWLKKHIPDELRPKTGVTLKFQYDLRRAYAQGTQGTIHFGTSERDPAVVVHEVGHVLHWNTPAVMDMIQTWFMKRTDNLKLKWDKRHGEDVIPDSFSHTYIGRIYGWEKKHGAYFIQSGHTSTGIYGQEVFSMGLQFMFEDPAKFYNEDKDHFLLTYAIMKGLF